MAPNASLSVRIPARQRSNMAVQQPLRTLATGIAAIGVGAVLYGIAGALFAGGSVLAYLITRRAARWFAPDTEPEHHRAINSNNPTT